MSPDSDVTSIGRLVTVLNDNDVLLGRGAPIVKYVGNQRFRALVRERTADYTTAVDRTTKDAIAQSIFETIQEKNGRFLRKLETSDDEHVRLNAAEGVDLWIVVDEAAALHKVKQAIRDCKTSDAAMTPSTPVFQTSTGIFGSGSLLRPQGQPRFSGMDVGETLPVYHEALHGTAMDTLRNQQRLYPYQDFPLAVRPVAPLAIDSSADNLLRQVPQSYQTMILNAESQNLPSCRFDKADVQLLIRARSLAMHENDGFRLSQIHQIMVYIHQNQGELLSSEQLSSMLL